MKPSQPNRPARSSATGPGRGWVKVLLAILSPIGFLLLVEGALRLGGFGHPTTYFIPGAEPGLWVENRDFGVRFFPPGLLRVPPPTRIEHRKPAGTIRILIFGESAAMGDPRPAYGMARYLEVLLRERFPGAAFEVIPVAMTAINSHALLPMARECTALDADYWIVFAGNNEMLGPFGAGGTMGADRMPVAMVRCILAAKATRLGQAIEAVARRWRNRPSGGSRWTGLRVLAGDNVAGDSPKRTRVYDAFERNLRDLVHWGRSGGAQVLLSTVAVNLADCGPFGASSREPLDPAVVADEARLLDRARLAFAKGAFDLESPILKQAIATDNRNAGLQFLLGHALLAETNQAEARQSLALARDWDSIPLRTDSRLNAIIRRVAGEAGVPLIDVEEQLGRAASRAVPGREFFYEHVHLLPEGNYAIASIFAEALLPLLPEAVRKTAPEGAWAALEICDTRLALTAWNRASAADMMLRRCLDAPFTNRVNHAANLRQLAEEVSRQRRAQTPEAARFLARVYTNAIAAASTDHHLRRGYAEFLEATGDIPEAIKQWQRVIELTPHHPVGYLQAATLLRRSGDTVGAMPLIEKAVAMQPDWVEARLELGDLFMARGRPGSAVAAYEAAIQIQPEHARAHLRLADAQAADKRRDLALENLKQAVRFDPRLWEARYLLGVEYAVNGQLEAAQEEFQEVVRLKPDHARGQYNLGIAYAQQARWDEAITNLSEAVRLEPRNDSARQALQQAIANRQKAQAPQTHP